MDERMEKRAVQQVMGNTLAGIQEDPYMTQRVLAEARRAGRVRLPGRKLIALLAAAALMLTGGVGLAWSLSREYFQEVAQITLTSGDYESWSLAEKRYMAFIMGKYGLIGEGEAERLAREDEETIDAFMLERYGFDSKPELSNISIDRIAWVELGPYTEWSNETWVWYCDMMFEIGLWTEKNDVDVYEMPGEEAIPPEEAIAIAAAHLTEQGYAPEQLAAASVSWHYMTHASDVNRADMVYLIKFRFPEGGGAHLFLTPDGKLR